MRKQRLDEIQQRKKIDTAFERIKDRSKVRVYTEVAVSVFNIIMLFTGLILFSLDRLIFFCLFNWRDFIDVELWPRYCIK